MHCEICGDLCSEERHRCNGNLKAYSNEHKSLASNRNGAYVSCEAYAQRNGTRAVIVAAGCVQRKIRLELHPNQRVYFEFDIKNETSKFDMLIVGTQLAHPWDIFRMTRNSFVHGEEPFLLKRSSAIPPAHRVLVEFSGADAGQYEMPIYFTFLSKYDPNYKANEEANNKKAEKCVPLTIVRTMVVLVQETSQEKLDVINSFKEVVWKKSILVGSTAGRRSEVFSVPPLLKKVIPAYVGERDRDTLPEQEDLRNVVLELKTILDAGVVDDNYDTFFRNLLWWEEIMARKRLKKYNMPNAKLELIDGDDDYGNNDYALEVPGLAEKRPSVLLGDRVFIKPNVSNIEIIFEGVITKIEDNIIHIGHLHDGFTEHYHPEAVFSVRFIMSRYPLQLMHSAVSRVCATAHMRRLFPRLPPPNDNRTARPIARFFNPLILSNEEQKHAVEHIVSMTSGMCPYIVYGPPGTGKTMTIVEAVLQIVKENPKNRVLVCTDSNMAADHVALQILRYKDAIKVDKFLFRANSLMRSWECMPAALADVSNGHSIKTGYSVSAETLSEYRVVVTTLLHSAKYARSKAMVVSHLFIDEAAQALEPTCLVPLVGLLAAGGHLVLSGDPQQLGPVLSSYGARNRGLGKSLMERLQKDFSNIYDLDMQRRYKYITMLVKNFRSHPDILDIPNQEFYEGLLQPQISPNADPLSSASILGGDAGAAVFCSVNSKEQRLGSSPSYFNEIELEMLQKYVTKLIVEHKVKQCDIGVITPYMRQVQKMSIWLKKKGFKDIEVGTVESFQGKEKRVILISTVRANCKLIDYDAKYSLGFLTDEKRFNVAVTRAKAKLVVVGNRVCLDKNTLWSKYMTKCDELGSYIGKENEQLARTVELMAEIAITRFNRSRIRESIKKIESARTRHRKK